MRLIDADALKTAFPCGEYVRTESVRATIDSMPTIDAEPVRHGHWEFIGGYGYQYRCSNCVRCAEYRTNYCPHCGSRMEE